MSDTLRLDNLAFGTRVMFRDGNEGIFVGQDTGDEDDRYMVVKLFDDECAELNHLFADGHYYNHGDAPDTDDVVALASARITVHIVTTSDGQVYTWHDGEPKPYFTSEIVDKKTVVLKGGS